jgi:hypothetical protein
MEAAPERKQGMIAEASVHTLSVAASKNQSTDLTSSCLNSCAVALEAPLERSRDQL